MEEGSCPPRGHLQMVAELQYFMLEQFVYVPKLGSCFIEALA
jgi:hypothetical protein